MADEETIKYGLKFIAEGVQAIIGAVGKIDEAVDEKRPRKIKIDVETNYNLSNARRIHEAFKRQIEKEQQQTERETSREYEANIRESAHRRSPFVRGMAAASRRIGVETEIDTERESRLRKLASATFSELTKGIPQEEALANARKRVAGATRNANEALGPFEKFLSAIGMGAFRRGGAQGATSIFERMGLGPGASAFLGGMTGAVLSSITLPIAWAIGNALMNLPQFAEERVGYGRRQESLGARGGGGGTARAEWLRRTGELETFFGGVKDTKDERILHEMSGMMTAYQAEGVKGDSAEATRAQKAALTVGMLYAAGIESDPQGAMREWKRLDYGAPSERARAMKALAEKGYLHTMLLDEIKREHELSGPVGNMLAEQMLQRRLDIDPGLPGSYAPQHFRYLMEQTARNDPRVRGQLLKERGEYRLFGEQGFSNTVWPSPAMNELTEAEQEFISRVRGIHAQYARGTPFWAKVGILPATEEEARAKAVRDFLPKATTSRADELTRWALGKAGETERLPSVGPDEKTHSFMPAQYQWTSFAGLADQMQMMWSGAPVDAMQTASDTLGRIEGILDSRLPPGGSGRTPDSIEDFLYPVGPSR